MSSDVQRPWLLNRRSEAIRSNSLFTFDFAKKPKKPKAKTDVAKAVGTAIFKSDGKINSQKENKRRSLIPVKRKLDFEDDEYEDDEEDYEEEDEQEDEVKKRKFSIKKNKVAAAISSPKRHLKSRQVEDSPAKAKKENGLKLSKTTEIPSNSTEITRKSSTSSKIPSKSSKTDEIPSKSSKTNEIPSKSSKTNEIPSKSSNPTEIIPASSKLSNTFSNFSKTTEALSDTAKISSNSSKTSNITPSSRKTSLKPKQSELEIAPKQNQNDNSTTKFDALKKNKESETNPNYDLIQVSPSKKKEAKKRVKVKEENSQNSSSLELYNAEAPVELIVDPDMEDYFSLENSREMGNVVVMKKSDLVQTIQFAEPGDMVTKQVYKGVNAESFSITDGTVTGYLTIEPRTIKPMEMTPNTSLIYWILEGEVTVKSTTHVSCGGNNFLHGKQLSAGCCIVVPPKTPYMLINKSEELNAMLGYVLLSS